VGLLEEFGFQVVASLDQHLRDGSGQFENAIVVGQIVAINPQSTATIFAHDGVFKVAVVGAGANADGEFAAVQDLGVVVGHVLQCGQGGSIIFHLDRVVNVYLGRYCAKMAAAVAKPRAK
jgi:hypothetical protein